MHLNQALPWWCLSLRWLTLPGFQMLKPRSSILPASYSKRFQSLLILPRFESKKWLLQAALKNTEIDQKEESTTIYKQWLLLQRLVWKLQSWQQYQNWMVFSHQTKNEEQHWWLFSVDTLFSIYYRLALQLQCNAAGQGAVTHGQCELTHPPRADTNKSDQSAWMW